MKHSLLPSVRRLFLLRHESLRVLSLRALPLVFLTGALAQVANAQTTGAPATTPGALSSLLSMPGAFAFLALLVGAVRPRTFTFLFKEKTTRKRVCGIFGAAMVGFAMVGSAFEPKPVVPVVTAQERRVQSDQAKAQSQARAAENRAKAAEARAEKAEKSAAAASANAKSSKRSGRRVAETAREDSEAPASEKAPAKEPLADNVEMVDISGVGKREAGVVDDVVYVIGKAETTQSLGSEVYRRQADGVFYVLQVVANNTDKKTHDVTTAIMELVDDQEREFDPSSEGNMALSMAGEQSAEPFSAQLQPGVTKKFTLVYDAPADAKGLKLHIPAGFGFGQSADIRVPPANEQGGENR